MVCKNCGSTLPEDTTYCMNCNTWQNEDTNKTEQKVENNTSNDKDENKAHKRDPKFLVEDEHIIARAKWTLIPFILLWGLILLVEIIFTANYGINTYRIYLNNGYSLLVNLRSTCIAIILITLLICALSIILFLIRRELVVTNKKVYGRIGIIGTKQFIIPLDKINYISIRYNILTRILNSALFIVYPGNSFFGIHFHFVAQANNFKKAVEKAVYENK